MRPITVTVGPLATASANAIALSQTPAAGPLILNGATVVNGVAILDQSRRILLTVTANESTKTFTIIGTSNGVTPQTEVLQGVAAGTAQSFLDFKTIISITISAGAAGALTFGTSAVASTPWIRLDEWASPATAIQCVVTGTVNYSVQETLQDPNSSTNAVLPYQVIWNDSLDPNVVGATATQLSYFPNTPIFTRVTLNSGTGSVSSVFSQFNVVSR